MSLFSLIVNEFPLPLNSAIPLLGSYPKEIKNICSGLGAVAHARIPSYEGGRDQEDDSRPVRQKVSETRISTNNPSMVACTCHPSTMGGIGRRISVQDQVLEYLPRKCETLKFKLQHCPPKKSLHKNLYT
jgi:hypothetical protein